MARFRCTDHNVVLEVSGERGERRTIIMPPQVTPVNRGRIGAGIPSDCALPTTRDPVAGEIGRRDIQGRPLYGVCHIVEEN